MGKSLPKRLTREEAAALLAQPSRRYPTGVRDRALIRVLYCAGLRCSEALNLRPRDVQLAHKRWTVNFTTWRTDATILGDEWSSSAVLHRTARGTITGLWDVIGDAGQTALHNAAIEGVATVTLELYMHGASGYQMSACISDVQTRVPVDGPVSFAANFRSTGTVTSLAS